MAALREVGAGHVKIVPDIQVGGDSGVLGGVGALLMRNLAATGGASGNGSGEVSRRPRRPGRGGTGARARRRGTGAGGLPAARGGAVDLSRPRPPFG